MHFGEHDEHCYVHFQWTHKAGSIHFGRWQLKLLSYHCPEQWEQISRRVFQGPQRLYPENEDKVNTKITVFEITHRLFPCPVSRH
jgi:hypothetical protein